MRITLKQYRSIILNIFIFTVIALLFWKIEPRLYRKGDFTKSNISRPYIEKETIPIKYIYFFSFITFIYSIFFPVIHKVFFLPIFLVLSEMNAIMYSAINILKYGVSKGRPDFNDRVALDDENLIIEGYRSFPSGHSATMALCVFFIIFITIFYSKEFYRFFILCIIPTVPYVMISRIIDNKHFMTDVLCGFFIGFSIAFIFIFYRMNIFIFA